MRRTDETRETRNAHAQRARSRQEVGPFEHALKLTVGTADGKLPAYQAARIRRRRGSGRPPAGRLDETQLSSVGYGRDHHNRVDGRCVRQEATRGARAAAGAGAGSSGSGADQADTASGSAPPPPAAPKTPTEDDLCFDVTRRPEQEGRPDRHVLRAGLDRADAGILAAASRRTASRSAGGPPRCWWKGTPIRAAPTSTPRARRTARRCGSRLPGQAWDHGGSGTVVSKGEEAPFCTEESESCWQQNRRGHFIFTAK